MERLMLRGAPAAEKDCGWGCEKEEEEEEEAGRCFVGVVFVVVVVVVAAVVVGRSDGGTPVIGLEDPELDII